LENHSILSPSNLMINNEHEIEFNLQNQNFSFITEPETDPNLMQKLSFRSSENKMYDLPLEVHKHQAIISLTNDKSQEDVDNQTFSLDNEMKNDLHSDNLSVHCCTFKCSQSHAHKAKKVIDVTKQHESLQQLIVLKAKDPEFVVMLNIE
ncbi:26371_t:CDS:2, partial [Racocetra persica]